ncbi:MAG: 4a-hydroxytetrahydrobiopterin dehydratase [Anaerolineae bacterium]|nr:4a-hydroxytetrahydrobiopterin dehydratase [Anaerolineae bacterium]
MMSDKYAPLDDAQIAARLASLPGWERDGDTIRKTFKLSSYIAGSAFAAAIGTICESFDHHPDRLCIEWKAVTVSFCTHSAGSKLTPLDFDVADVIEALPYRKP